MHPLRPRILGLCALLLTLLFSACASGTRVRTEQAGGVDFNQYRTYQVLPGRVIPEEGVETPRSLEGARIIHAVLDAELQRVGLRPVAVGEEPQVVVSFLAGVQSKAQLVGAGAINPNNHIVLDPTSGGVGPYDANAYYSFDNGGLAMDEYWAEASPEGTLAISVFDPKENLLLWRALCTAPTNRPDLEALVRKALHKAFNQYPVLDGAR